MSTKAEDFKMLEQRSRPKRAPRSEAPVHRNKLEHAQPGESARDRATGETGQGTRNSAKMGKEAVFALEASTTKPSRKSTRKSPAHVKTDSQLKRRQTRAATSPQAAAAKGATHNGARKAAARSSNAAKINTGGNGRGATR